MAILKTEAILLRRQEVRETSLLLTAFGRDLGKFRGLVKGVRGARGAVPWYLEPLTLQSVILYERRRSPWALVSACDLLDSFDSVRRDLHRTAYAAFCLELVEAMTEVGDPNPGIFHLLLSTLRALGDAPSPRSAVLCLEARLLKICGLLPPTESIQLSADGKRALNRMLHAPEGEAAGLPLEPVVEEGLSRLLQGLARRATERPLRSRDFLLALGLEGPVVTGSVIARSGATRQSLARPAGPRRSRFQSEIASLPSVARNDGP